MPENFRGGCTILVIVLAGSCMEQASAANLILAPLADGYSNCSYVDNGNGTSTLTVTISWKQAEGYTGGQNFFSRGVLFYTYDTNGQLRPMAIATSVTLNNISYGFSYDRPGYVMYAGSNWKKPEPYLGTVRLTFKNVSVTQWPAIGVRAGNYTNSNDIADSAGLVYITTSNKNGECKMLVDPSVPPPPDDVLINMEAPDWDLGELVRGGVTHKSFSSPQDQLCFTYKGNNFITYQEYVIDASNRNGLSVNGKYQLKHQDAQAPGLPYQLTLNESANNVVLPNPSRRVFKLNNNGKTCFMPTFDVSTDKNAKGGIYSDVLTFTITAKS